MNSIGREKLACFIDYSNIFRTLRGLGIQPDPVTLRNYLMKLNEGRDFVETFVYIPSPVRENEKVLSWHNYLRSEGFMVITKPSKILVPGKLKCDLDAELMLDALEYAMVAKPDTILIVTGDGDYVTLLYRIRKLGIRAEVAAPTQCMARQLVFACNKMTDLQPWMNECPKVRVNGGMKNDEVIEEVL